MVQIRVWKYLDMNGTRKQLVDILEVQKENEKLFVNELEELYNYYNYFIEVKEV